MSAVIIGARRRPHMEKHRWERIDELYHSALELPAHMRSTFLSEACAGDPDLVREVQDLIAHDLDSNSAVDRPAWERVAGMRDTPELESGTLLGPYSIDRLLGARGDGIRLPRHGYTPRPRGRNQSAPGRAGARGSTAPFSP